MVRFARSEGDDVIKVPLLRPFFEDMVECEELLDRSTGDEISFARRMYVRSFFAYLEVHIRWLSRNAEQWLLTSGSETRAVEITKLVLLSDDAFRPDVTGKLVAEANRIPFANWLAFVIRTCADRWGVDSAGLFGDNGWNAMRQTVKVRHRLTHPKTPLDAEVSEAEIDTLRTAHTWFLNCVVDIVNAAAQIAKKGLKH